MRHHKRIGRSLNDVTINGTNTNSVTCKCPFCDGEFTAGTELVDGKGGVIHSLPYCDEFIVNDVISFLAKARQRGVS